MFKSLATITLAIACSMAPVSAATSPFGVFVGNYSGGGNVHNASFSVVHFYSYFKIRVGSLGKVTGTCQDDSNKVLTITGKVTASSITGGFLSSATIHGLISDGGKWQGTMNAVSTAPQPYILGTCTKGKLSGSLRLDIVH